MEKDKRKIVDKETKKETNPEENAVRSDEAKYGVTVGMEVYKPIPRFHGNCKNC